MILYADIIIWVSTIAAWLFIIAYQLQSHGQWRKSQMGWHLMSLAGVDGTIFTLLLLGHLWPWLDKQSWFLWLYLNAVAGIAVVTIWRLVYLLLIQEEDQDEHQDSSSVR